MIRAYSPIKVRYTKDSGEVSSRTIIPTNNVPDNIRAIDISSVDEEGQSRLIGLFAEYEEYVNNHLSKLFSFTDWAEQVSGSVPEELPWRTFKRKNTEVIV